MTTGTLITFIGIGLVGAGAFVAMLGVALSVLLAEE